MRLGLERGGFELHPGSRSLGCITTNKNDPQPMQQYQQLDQLLQCYSRKEMGTTGYWSHRRRGCDRKMAIRPAHNAHSGVCRNWCRLARCGLLGRNRECHRSRDSGGQTGPTDRPVAAAAGQAQFSFCAGAYSSWAGPFPWSSVLDAFSAAPGMVSLNKHTASAASIWRGNTMP